MKLLLRIDNLFKTWQKPAVENYERSQTSSHMQINKTVCAMDGSKRHGILELEMKNSLSLTEIAAEYQCFSTVSQSPTSHRVTQSWGQCYVSPLFQKEILSLSWMPASKPAFCQIGDQCFNFPTLLAIQTS